MSHPLDGAFAKVEWAKGDIETLAEEIASWERDNPQQITGHFYPEANAYVFWVEFPEPPLLRWGVMVGNIVHNLRAPLDYLIEELVKANRKRPTGGNKFPLFKRKPADFRTSTKSSLERVDPAHRALIEGLEPWSRPDVPNLLVVLNDLANDDKHHVVIPVVRYIPEGSESQFPGWVNGDVGRIVDAGVLADEKLRSGAVFMWIALAPAGPNPEMHMQGSIPTAVVLQVEGQVFLALDILPKSLMSVEAILEAFRPVFEGKPFGHVGYFDPCA